ncbi:hypothetical protein [cf. Phormidesmis sp. LEGE 11477]|uniref:hypothetical protein n=1 Tax=cf. Phormidesmis sp. LEGE 11477 TaxID=1828680 RepID=UPI001880F082|nr:hypothetical protein [cf. Phormidesmis sp. LEGE 11477]MBE9061205.1 hypothetical protein [cf. Phormidesmis sp. LEGE 11477]
MKRFLFSVLTVVMFTTLSAASASAGQVNLGNPVADLNNDGKVTLHEVASYNRDQRDKS